MKSEKAVWEYEAQECEKEKAKLMVKSDGWNLAFLSTKLKDDKDVVMLAVKNVGAALSLASSRLKDDEEVVRMAIVNGVKDYPALIKDVSKRLRHNEAVMLLAIRKNAIVLKWLPSIFKEKDSVVLEALKIDDESIEYASKRIREQVETFKRQNAAFAREGTSLSTSSVISGVSLSGLTNAQALEQLICKNFAKRERIILNKSISGSDIKGKNKLIKDVVGAQGKSVTKNISLHNVMSESAVGNSVEIDNTVPKPEVEMKKKKFGL